MRAGTAAALLVAACASEPVATGDAVRGREVFVSRDAGHCVLCHSAPGIAGGNVGPALAGVGARLGVDELRVRVADITRVKPEAAMPAFHRTADLRRVAAPYRGKPVLTDRELEDVVAFLTTLK